MKIEEYKYMINSYFDGELDRGKEAALFTYLSQNEECREYFKGMNLLKASVEKSFEEFPQELEEKIFYSLEKADNRKLPFLFTNNLFVVATYSIAVILLIISIVFYNESNSYKDKLEKSIERINKQEQLMQVIINSMPLPEITVRGTDDVIVSSKL